MSEQGREIRENLDEIRDLLNLESYGEDVAVTDATYTFDAKVRNDIANLIVYGTPGCGKSYYVKNTLLGNFDEDKIIRTTFYQDYTNTDFVGQILPVISGEDVTYKFNPGPFTIALEKAVRYPSKKVALVIEELNRGNAASIFGDIFQLLDRKDGKSEYPITNINIQMHLEDCFDGIKFGYIKLPSNMSIIATMNTCDQNVFTLDTAFKRRWEFLKLKNRFEKTGDNAHPYSGYFVPGMENTTWEEFVDTINAFMLSNNNSFLSEDKQLGVYFVGEELLEKNNSTENKEKTQKFAYKVLEYLWNDVAKFDRDTWFKTSIKSLDELVELFISSGKEVFQNGIFKKTN